MSGRPVFLTAIGTDSGKTHVAEALLRLMRQQGRPALALKPLMSGYSPEALETSDAGRLLIAMGETVTQAAVDRICWRAFTEWSAPNVAARRAGVTLDYADLLAFVREGVAGAAGLVLVEGAGGVMSPLTDTHTNIDLARDLGGPVLLMASNYLGAVSHTLTALESLNQRGLDPVAIVVTETLPNAGPAQPLIDELTRWTRLPLVHAAFARTQTDTDELAAALAALLPV